MKLLLAALAPLALALSAGAAPPKPFLEGLKNPESVLVLPDGKMYVTVIGEFDKAGDGGVFRVEGGKAVPVAEGMDDPKGIAADRTGVLYVTDKDKVWRIANGKADVFAAADVFPTPPKFLNDIVIDPEAGTIYVTDSGDLMGAGGAVFRIQPPRLPFPKKKDPNAPPPPPPPPPKAGKGQVTLLVDATKLPGLHTPNGLAMDGQAHLLLADFGTGNLYRVKVSDSSSEKIADGLGAADGLAWDYYGRLFITDWKGGRLFGINKPGDKPVLIAEGFKAAADLCYDPKGNRLVVPDMTAGTLTAMPAVVPGFEVDETPMAIAPVPAFAGLKWTGWKPETDDGKVNAFRPILLTHAGDGSGRVFVPTQQGVIHAFAPDAKETTVFLDLTDRVRYVDTMNEEGLLGLAFHPKYKENGEFFVFYTPSKEKKTNVVSRFRVSKDDPNKADPASEEQLLRYENKISWNHDGGTICFGPDGMLYVVHGDGGLANDPQENGQNLKTLYGKIVRIDVNAKDEGKPYAVPKDNPFVGREGARPEIWAYGLRNPWRMAFDRKTGQLWAGEVGQNLYEEIVIIQKGGNYGWNRRESYHPFGAKGVGLNKEMIEPVWEYHHDVGKSITGGTVYRGKQLPELDGYYLYADYVSNKLWALKYDEAKGRVVANRPMPDLGRPVISYGEDEAGEVYILLVSTTGKDGIFRFAKK
jgi:glucose/arabinose dehydrogenase